MAEILYDVTHHYSVSMQNLCSSQLSPLIGRDMLDVITSMASVILPLAHALQAGTSIYGLYNSCISITNLQQYEEKSEKAAEWSNTAAHQLHKTRTTQTTGALAVCFALLIIHINSVKICKSPLLMTQRPRFLLHF